MIETASGFVGVGLRTDKLGRSYITGVQETRKKLMQMGMERRVFERWIKDAAIIGATEAARTAPRQTGYLAVSIVGQASKKITHKSGASNMVFGGVILARTEYARAVSYGTFHKAGYASKTGNRTWLKTVRGKGNPYMVRARENTKPRMVELLNNRLRYWIKSKGFETNGF